MAAQHWDHSAGDQKAPKVLAIHGWLDNAASFDALAACLNRVNLVAIDLPGHGYSEHRSSDGSYHFIDWIPDVIRAADELGWEKFVLLGHSMGAAIASLVAGTYPERIERIIGIEGLGPLTAKEDVLPSRLRATLNERALLKGKRLTIYPDLQSAATARLKVSDIKDIATIAPLIERATYRSKEGFSWRSDPRLKLPTPWRLTTAQVAAFLSKITCPYLLIKASGGLAYDKEEQETFVGAVRQLQLVEISGGHHLHMETPEAVAKIIQDFLHY
jgi:pimeloyl-ACP methyl ester carboxylesterase